MSRDETEEGKEGRRDLLYEFFRLSSCSGDPPDGAREVVTLARADEEGIARRREEEYARR